MLLSPSGYSIWGTENYVDMLVDICQYNTLKMNTCKPRTSIIYMKTFSYYNQNYSQVLPHFYRSSLGSIITYNIHSEDSLARSMLFYSRNTQQQNWVQFVLYINSDCIYIGDRWLQLWLQNCYKNKNTIPYFSYCSYCF